MSTNSLTYWLRKQPQPTTVLADDKTIQVGKNGRAWRDLTATIEAMDPSKLTCLDAQGNILRSKVLAADDEPTAAGPSPEMTDLQLFAKLLAEAWDKAGSRMQPIVDSAMAFVERGGSRLAKAESENDRLRSHIHKLNMELARLSNAPETAPADDSLIGAVVSGMMSAAGGGGSVPNLAAVPAPAAAVKGGKKP